MNTDSSVPIDPGDRVDPIAVDDDWDEAVRADEVILAEMSKRRRKLIAVVLSVLAVTGGVTAGVVYGVPAAFPHRTVVAAPSTSPPPTALHAAWDRCGAGELSDGDHTLFLDMAGGDANSGFLTAEDVQCVLDALGTPSYVVTEMEQTRALDGRLSDTWGSYQASWSYHPDHGLDVLIRER